MRLVAVAVVLLASTALLPSVLGQATSAPPFAAGAVKSYCHVTDATNAIWMNTLVDDGDGVPYEFYGAPATTIPGVGAGVDPVADEDFEARIPLAPALAQDLVLAGTVNVQAYIGGGTYTSGTGTIGTSLVVGGAVIGSAQGKSHRMIPHQAGETYDAISWTFDVPSTTVPAGTLVEWVISGSSTGNNVFLACHEARGRSHIELPVASASGGAASVVEHQLNGTTAKVSIDAAEPTNATHLYHWTTDLTKLSLRIAAQASAGNATIVIRDGANATVHNGTYTGNVSREVQAAAGNWSFTITLDAFQGNLTVEAGPVLPPTGTTSGSATGTGTGKPGSKTSTATNAGNGTGNETDDGKKDTPAPAMPFLVGAIGVALALVRRRRA